MSYNHNGLSVKKKTGLSYHSVVTSIKETQITKIYCML